MHPRPVIVLSLLHSYIKGNHNDSPGGEQTDYVFLSQRRFTPGIRSIAASQLQQNPKHGGGGQLEQPAVKPETDEQDEDGGVTNGVEGVTDEGWKID